MNNFSSLRVKSSVYVDVKSEMRRVVLLNRFFTPGAIFCSYQGLSGVGLSMKLTLYLNS